MERSRLFSSTTDNSRARGEAAAYIEPLRNFSYTLPNVARDYRSVCKQHDDSARDHSAQELDYYHIDRTKEEIKIPRIEGDIQQVLMRGFKKEIEYHDEIMNKLSESKKMETFKDNYDYTYIHKLEELYEGAKDSFKRYLELSYITQSQEKGDRNLKFSQAVLVLRWIKEYNARLKERIPEDYGTGLELH